MCRIIGIVKHAVLIDPTEVVFYSVVFLGLGVGDRRVVFVEGDLHNLVRAVRELDLVLVTKLVRDPIAVVAVDKDVFRFQFGAVEARLGYECGHR